MLVFMSHLCCLSVYEYPRNVFLCDGKSSYHSSNFAVIKSVALSLSLLLFLFLYSSRPRTLVFIVFRILYIYLCLKYMTFLPTFEMSVVLLSYILLICQYWFLQEYVIANIFRFFYSLTNSRLVADGGGRRVCLCRVHHIPQH